MRRNLNSLVRFQRYIKRSLTKDPILKRLDRRMQVSITPPPGIESDFCPKQLSLRYHKGFIELLALIYLLHKKQLPQFLRVEVQLCLEEEEKKRSRPLDKRVAITSFLNNSFRFHSYLSKQNDRWLFGTFSEAIHRCVRSLRLHEVHKRKPQKGDRVRGYRDHGTLRPRHKWMESSDMSFTEKHNEIEKEDHIAAVLTYTEMEHYFSMKRFDAEGESSTPPLDSQEVESKESSQPNHFPVSNNFSESFQKTGEDLGTK